MTIREKVKAVESVFNELERASKAFQKESGLQCISGCGKCCFKSDIEATPLEFLPFAFQVFKEGKAMEWFEKLKGTSDPFCSFLKPFFTEGEKGLCTQYQYRGLVCRLFGFSARINKYGQKELLSCKRIKEEQTAVFAEASEKVLNGGAVPVSSHYYLKLHGIDPILSREFYPINVAVRKAIEVVLQYYTYRTKRSA